MSASPMRRISSLLIVTLALGGCSMLESKKIDYKSAGTLPALDVPPDLIAPSNDSRFVVPDIHTKGSATFSAYDRERAGKPLAAVGAQTTLLPSVDKVSIERAGSQRWLSVQLPPNEVWFVIRDFWQELGFIIALEMPEAGLIETDWAENRANIPQTGIRSWLGKATDMFFSTAERDKFRTRLETAANGRTEIYISHRGMYEVYEGTQAGGDQGQGRTMWQPRSADAELEAEMLRRLMVRFGVEDNQAKAVLAQKTDPRAVLVKGGQTAPGLNLPETFDRAWRRIGLALDRIGFAVEDRDRAAGVYYVRYVDPEANTKKDKGFFSKLAFWNSEDKKSQSARYQIKVKGSEDNMTQLGVYLDDGAPAKNETGERIATLLFEQLK